jgi:hypothetical protein
MYLRRRRGKKAERKDGEGRRRRGKKERNED